MPPEIAARVLELVGAALDRAPEERSAFLDQACADNNDLRAEIDSLLRQQTRVVDFIESSPATLVGKAISLAAESPGEGRRVGAYRLLRRVGRGGMGSVYLAERDDKQYRKQVAIKLITFGLDYEEVERRFRHERQILATLEHPNITKLLDGGTTEDGLAYFVMDFVDGLPIDQYCATQRLGLPERLELFRSVCSAVHYAHQHLVIHRDIKPGNILVTSDGVPKLLDFGIAQLLESDSALALTRTLAGNHALTPQYASPEQIKGDNITTASDIYGLGVILYELLTGAKPYRLTNKSAHELERAIVEEEPARPSAVTAANQPSTGGLQRSPKGELDNIVLMALRKEPTRRYTSVAQFSEDIRRYLAGLPVLAHPDSVGYRAIKFIKRHRVGVAAALLILLSLLGGIIATGMQTLAARRENAKAEATIQFLQTMLRASSPSFNTRAGQTTVKDILDQASQRLAQTELSGQPQVKAELQRIVGASYLDIGEYALAEQNLTAALTIQTRLLGEDSLESLKTAAALANLWVSVRGNYAKANQFYRSKLSLLRVEQKRERIGAEYLGLALYGAALLSRAQGDSREAELLLREELELAAKLPPNSVAVSEAVLALTLADQGKFEPAIEMMRAKIALLRQQPESDTPALAGSLTGLGSFLLESGKLVEAEQVLHDAEAIYRKRFHASNIQLGDNLRLQAQALYLANRFEEADARINEALEIYRSAASPAYVNYPTALSIQGLIYDRTSRPADAEKLLREAVRLRTEGGTESHFLRATAKGALGEFLTTHQRFEEAEPFLLTSHESLEKSQDPRSPRLTLARQRLFILYQQWGKPEQGTRYQEEPSPKDS